jgi:hypothetical protein
MKRCSKEGCNKILIEKHQDTDRMGRLLQWYRCIGGHWVSEAVKE